MENHSTRIVQISDIHLFADIKNDLLGVKTYESFVVLLKLLKSAKIQPSLILLTGDLSQDCSERSYAHYLQLMEEFAVPIYYVPGNHDDQKTMEKILNNKYFSPNKNIILKQWQIILLDTQKPKHVYGYLDQGQLTFLEDCLQKNPHLPAIIVFHHHPVPVGSAWLDPLGMKNAQLFWDILQRYPQVHTLFFGHIHQVHEGEKNGIRYFSAPSTCIQFKCNSELFALDKLAPGYRWIDLAPQGTLATGVVRAAHYVGRFEQDATGY